MRHPILIFSLLIFLGFCLQTQAAISFFNDNSLKENIVMNAFVTSSGIVDLQKDAYSNSSFYVLADFSNYNYSQYPPDSSNPTIIYVDTKKIMISIVNRETMVSQNCFNFTTFDCNRYRCDKYDSNTTFDFPTFTANVQKARSYIYLDYTHWILAYNDDFSYIAQSCQTGDTPSSFGSNRHGVLGLGTASGSRNAEIFSIFIDSTLNKGQLIFKKDTTYAQSSSPLCTFSSNSTWQIQVNNGYIQLGSDSAYFYGNVMFDVNSDAIGLPPSIYSELLNYFDSFPDIICYSGDNYRPSCKTNKQLKDLPDITLGINTDQITIPSQIYATFTRTSGDYNYFYLNFKSTSPDLSGKNYISPAFATSIILDANFMSYYYTVFDATSGYNYISLYPSLNAPVPPSNPVPWIASGTVITILLISILCCCTKKKPGTTITLDNATQPPFVYNQQGVITSAPTSSYDATNYSYPGYNYSAQPQSTRYIPPVSHQIIN